MNIYVGNLAFEATDKDVQELFEAFGRVASVVIIKDKYTGDPRGFGFVDMPSKEEAQSAILSLNGKELKGRELRINEARPRNETRRGGKSGRRGGYRSNRNRRPW